ncbi:hypothetical protein IIY24_02760 [Candidatus Saccharibacteria bacterium]|nr:hypothetical protein [Candidatus Saccharibacteria bacterium]
MAKRDYYKKSETEQETQMPVQVTPVVQEPKRTQETLFYQPEPVVTPVSAQEAPSSSMAKEPASVQKPGVAKKPNKATVSTSSAPKQRVKKPKPAPSKSPDAPATKLEFPDGLIPKRMYVWRDIQTGELMGPVSDIWAAKQASYGLYDPVWCWVTKEGEYFADFFTREELEKFFSSQKRP